MPKISLICQACGNPFFVKPCHANTARFCSRPCGYGARKPRRKIPASQRFWSQVKKTSTCWVWKSFEGTSEYPKFINDKGERVKVSHFSWELHYGPIPEGKKVLHKCDNPPCIRPDDLFLGSQADNMRDMMNKGRNVNPKGLTHYRSKFTEEQIREIRTAFPAKSQGQIAREFGVCQTTISCIVRRTTWKHI